MSEETTNPTPDDGGEAEPEAKAETKPEAKAAKKDKSVTFSDDEQEILKLFKVKDADPRQLLGVIKRLNTERTELRSTIAETEHGKKYAEFIETGLAGKQWISDAAKDKFDKAVGKLDRKSDTYWEEVTETFDIFTVEKPEPESKKDDKKEDKKEDKRPAEKVVSKTFTPPTPQATSLRPSDLIKKLAAGEQLTKDDFKLVKR